MKTYVPRWTRLCLRVTIPRPVGSPGSCTAWPCTQSTSRDAGKKSRRFWETGRLSNGEMLPHWFNILCLWIIFLCIQSEELKMDQFHKLCNEGSTLSTAMLRRTDPRPNPNFPCVKGCSILDLWFRSLSTLIKCSSLIGIGTLNS